MNATIAAIHRSSRRETAVGVKVGDTIRKETILFDGRSVDEAVLLGWIRGVEIAQEMGAACITFVVNRKVLEGQLRLGWKVRSLAMLAAWKLLVSSTKSPANFIYPASRDAGCSSDSCH